MGPRAAGVTPGVTPTKRAPWMNARSALTFAVCVVVLVALLCAPAVHVTRAPLPAPLATSPPRPASLKPLAATRAPRVAVAEAGTDSVLPAASTPSDSSPDAVDEKRKRSSAAPRWCILPIGDSLTQGVGSHGSYRESMAAALVTQTRGVSRVGFAGTRVRPCIAKKPDAIFSDATGEEKGSPDLQRHFGPSDLRHEGHCNWDSTSLLRHWESLVSDGMDERSTSPPPPPISSSTTRCAPLEYHTALLMVGHNDVFRIARMCKVREGCSASTWAPSKDAHEASIDVPDTLPQNLRCALANMKRGFQRNLEKLVASLLDHAAGPPPSRVAKFQGAQDPPKVVIGVNPPTGFPCLDVMLRRAIGQAVLELRRRGADGNTTAPRDVDRVTVAQFTGFERGVHTFDSTHPNAKGGALLGQQWADVLVGGGFDLDPFTALAATGS